MSLTYVIKVFLSTSANEYHADICRMMQRYPQVVYNILSPKSNVIIITDIINFLA